MVTVIIPVYNTELYLRHCLDSVAGQTYKDLEVLLIDDGSTDDSPRICDEYAEKDSRFKVWHLVNGGVSKARNFGLEQSHGEWICCVDSDDWIAPDMFEKLIHLAKRTGAGTVCCGAFQGDETSVEERRIWRRFESSEHVYVGKEVLSGIIEQSATLWNKLLNGDRARALRFVENIRFAEDTLFLAQYLENETKAAVTKENLYYYRCNRAGNVVSAGLNERHIDFLNATGMLYALLKKNDLQVVGIERVVDAVVRVLALIRNTKTQRCYIEAVSELCAKAYSERAIIIKKRSVRQMAKYIMLCLAYKKSRFAVRFAKIFMSAK